MYTLFIDTHFKIINLCLYKDIQILEMARIESSKSTSEETIPAIIKILNNNKIKASNIKRIIVCIGPGSFTGIRIGLTIAKTLAYLNSASIYTITSLELKALNNKGIKTFGVKENNGVYLAKFQDDKIIGDIIYLKNTQSTNFPETIFFNDIIDYQKLIENIDNLTLSDSLSVSPLYVKTIEALNDKRN